MDPYEGHRSRNHPHDRGAARPPAPNGSALPPADYPSRPADPNDAGGPADYPSRPAARAPYSADAQAPHPAPEPVPAPAAPAPEPRRPVPAPPPGPAEGQPGGAPPGPRAPAAAPAAAPGGVWRAFLGRVVGILLRPKRTWQRVAGEAPTLRTLLWPHLTVLVLGRTLAEFLGALFQGGRFGYALAQFVFGILAWFAVAWVFGFAVASYAATRRGLTGMGDGMRFSVLSLTPLLVVGALTALIPVPIVVTLADLLLLPYTFYLMARGVIELLAIPTERAPTFVAVTNGLLLILVGLLPILVRSILPSFFTALVAAK